MLGHPGGGRGERHLSPRNSLPSLPGMHPGTTSYASEFRFEANPGYFYILIPWLLISAMPKKYALLK